MNSTYKRSIDDLETTDEIKTHKKIAVKRKIRKDMNLEEVNSFFSLILTDKDEKLCVDGLHSSLDYICQQKLKEKKSLVLDMYKFLAGNFEVISNYPRYKHNNNNFYKTLLFKAKEYILEYELPEDVEIFHRIISLCDSYLG
jgi:uncharacterized membrane protein YjjP (DUF1212 family)